MTKRKLTLLGAAIGSALLAASASAVDRIGAAPAGDYGMVLAQSASDVTRTPPGRAVIPSGGPTSPNESKPSVAKEEPFRAAPREDNPRLPNPVTPSAANESAPQPKALREPTNATGMEGQRPVGAGAMGASPAPISGSESRALRSPGAALNDAARPTPVAPASATTLPSRNAPASVSESAPQRTGKEVSSGPVADDRNMPNPRTPSAVSESAPDKTGKEQRGVGGTR